MRPFFMALLAIGMSAVDAAPASAGNKPVRLIAEAEDFSVESGWDVVPYGENYFASTFAITFLSRQACLGAPAQMQAGREAVASQVVDVPADDAYRVMARYEQPYRAYLKSGLPLRPWDRGSTDNAYCHFLPTAMDARLREALVDDFLPEGFVRRVECDRALVEATCIDSADPPRLAVPLMNYSGKPIDSLTVKIHGLSRVARVRSVERGALQPRFRDSAMIVTVPIDVTDMLLIDR